MRSTRLKTAPLLSVVTVVLNEAGRLRETMDSIRSQGCSSVEVIVVDGGSTDSTVEVVRANRDVVSCWVSEPDEGIYDAMNKGASMARGGWVTFLNAGDRYDDGDTLRRVVAHLRRTRADVVHGDVEYERRGDRWQVRQSTNLFFLLRHMICHQTIFYRRELVTGRWRYDASYRIAADYDHLMRVMWRHRPEKLHRVVAHYRLDGVSSERSSLRLLWRERLRSLATNREMPVWLRAPLLGMTALLFASSLVRSAGPGQR